MCRDQHLTCQSLTTSFVKASLTAMSGQRSLVIESEHSELSQVRPNDVAELILKRGRMPPSPLRKTQPSLQVRLRIADHGSPAIALAQDPITELAPVLEQKAVFRQSDLSILAYLSRYFICGVRHVRQFVEGTGFKILQTINPLRTYPRPLRKTLQPWQY